ncbi:MAG TPA: tripartite tricarboxylate transporter substrate binding protein [Xanthobacteraceae bacterium]
MKLPRRSFLHFAASAAASAVRDRPAAAQSYPQRPVRVVVPLPAGSSPDIIARIIGQHLSTRLGQPFIIDNRPGANGNVGTEMALHAAPNGYTLLQAIAANTVNTTLYENLDFDFMHDIAPVAGVARIPQVMEINPSVPARTVPQFIAYAKANPGKLNMASGGVGGTPHVAGELFMMMTGVKMLHVPYSANPRPDLLSGRVQVMFDTLPASIAFLRDGKLRALAVTTASRVPVLPDVPALSEFLPGYEATSWQGLVAPRGTPGEVIATLNKAVTAGLAAAETRLAILGAVPMPMTPAEFGNFIADEIAKWAKVIHFANIRLE